LKKYRINKNSILKSKKEFTELFKNPFVCQTVYFKAFFVKDRESKVGFITQRGIVAVHRNKLKRKIRELWRTRYREFQVTAQIVFFVRQDALKASGSLLTEDFNSLMIKIQNVLGES
jgi:ribonuclease P protein component